MEDGGVGGGGSGGLGTLMHKHACAHTLTHQVFDLDQETMNNAACGKSCVCVFSSSWQSQQGAAESSQGGF